MHEGLHFFHDDVDRRTRRRRIAFVTLILVATAALIWPFYTPFAGIRPFLFGLPLSMAWVTLWVVIVFGALVWLCRSEEYGHDDSPAGTPARHPEGPLVTDPGRDPTMNPVRNEVDEQKDRPQPNGEAP